MKREVYRFGATDRDLDTVAHNDLFDTAKQSPGSVAVIDQTGSYTYEQLCERASRISAALLQSKDDLLEARVAMLIAPGFDYVATQWGIWQSGGIAVPLGLMHPTPELSYTINDAEVTTVIVHPKLQNRISNVAAAQSLEVLTTEQVASAEPLIGLRIVAPDRRAMILYTSGRRWPVICSHLSNVCTGKAAEPDTIRRICRAPSDHLRRCSTGAPSHLAISLA